MARHAVTRFDLRTIPLQLEPRSTPGFAPDELLAQLTPATKPFTQCLAAMGLSWRARIARPIGVPALDFSRAQVLLLPGESCVEFQPAAQRERPERTGYIPTDRTSPRATPNLRDWCWIVPGSEPRLRAAVREALRAHRSGFTAWVSESAAFAETMLRQAERTQVESRGCR